jgi:hypothetical protein
MFFCKEKDPRKKARKILDEGGLLKRLPGFRTGHQARQPNVGSLIQPATEDELPHHSNALVVHSHVYYDPWCSIRALGMPIFVKQNDGSWRQATAYRVFKGDQCMLMSVAHVFAERTEVGVTTPSDDESDFNLGSDSGSEVEEHGERTTSDTLEDMRISDSTY